MDRFERVAKKEGFDSAELINSVLKRWLSENYAVALRA